MGSMDDRCEVAVAETTNKSTKKVENSSESSSIEDSSSLMKLIVRSQYWGRILKGKTRRDDTGKSYRVISCQAVLSNEGQYWGCCPHHGKRVLELHEFHFADHNEDCWDLYMMGSSVTPSNAYHNFFLLPQNQDKVDINHNMRFNGWSYVGTVSTSIARLDLHGLLHGFLKENNEYGFRYHHIHIDVLMDQVYDRETPRSRKAANEKARAERHVTSSVTSDSPRPEDNELEKVENTIHPPPHVISNCPSWESQTTYSSSVPSMGYDYWNDSFCHSMNYPTEAVQWYPAAPPQQMMMPQGLPLQQMLQGFRPNTFPPMSQYHDPRLVPDGWMMMHPSQHPPHNNRPVYEGYAPPLYPPSVQHFEGGKETESQNPECAAI